MNFVQNKEHLMFKFQAKEPHTTASQANREKNSNLIFLSLNGHDNTNSCDFQLY